MQSEKLASWSRKNVEMSHSSTQRMYPTEYVLRAMCSGKFFKLRTDLAAGRKILDIGCLYANNLVPFASRGLLPHGIEINEEMVSLARKAASVWEIEAEVRQGTNRSIPFPDNYFDIVLSVATIHYEDGKDQIKQALSEFVRVGNSQCHYLISTAAAEHAFHRTAVRRGENSYQLHTNEFRDGQIMSFFDSKEHFSSVLSEFFGSVEVAVITEEWPSNPLQFWVAKCAK